MPPKILWLMFVLLLLVLVSPLPTQAQNLDPLNFDNYHLPLTDYTLPNGLRVILAEDHSAPVVAVDLWYRVGGADDPQDRSGFAHMYEHMMFEGSANIPTASGTSCWSRLGPITMPTPPTIKPFIGKSLRPTSCRACCGWRATAWLPWPSLRRPLKPSARW